jgi:phosphonate transport system substrate-binding protein
MRPVRYLCIVVIISLAITFSACKSPATPAVEPTDVPPTTELPPSTPTETQSQEPTIPPTIEPTLTPTQILMPTDTPTLPPLGEEGNPIVLGLPSPYNPENMDRFYAAIEEIEDIMMERTGLVVEAMVVNSRMEGVEKLCSGEVHMAVQSAFDYILANERGCAEIALIGAPGFNSVYLSQILVHKDSGITSLADLAGVTFCRTVAESQSGWIVPSLLMRAAGLDPENDLGEIIDAGEHRKVPIGIYNDVCEAGSTFVDIRDNLLGEYPDIRDVVTVLVQSPQIPQGIISFTPVLSVEMKTSFVEVFWYTAVNEEGRLLNELYGWDSLFEREDYLIDPLRELLDEAGVDIESIIE